MSRILFLSRWFPYPPNNGTKLRIYNLLRGLARRHELTLLSFADQKAVDPEVSALTALCREIQLVPWKPFNPQSGRARLGFLNLTPRSVIDTFSQEMAHRIQLALSTRHYDLVIASDPTTASYARFFKGFPALFEECEVGALYEKFAHASSAWHRLRFGLTWVKHRRHINHLLYYFGACTVVSEQEKQLVRSCAPDYESVEVIPNCVNLVEYEGIETQAQPNVLIFTGSFRYFPNYDAMVWFLREVYPRIRAEVPDIHLIITGDHSNLPLPVTDNLSLSGLVDDVRPLIASSWVSLAPIRQGGGTRLKILEAMALRTPVVATPKGVEGLDVQHDKHLLIADTPEDFAQEVIRLLKEPGLRQRLADNAYQLVQEKYDWAIVMPRFLNLVELIAQS